jgi:Uncharacterized protein conserved in archaea
VAAEPGPHSIELGFEFSTTGRAETISAAVQVEVNEVDDSRATASVTRQGTTVVVEIEANDLHALRAGINSWTRLISTAENTPTGH